MYNIIQKRKIWLSFSSILVVLSIIFIAMWGLNFGIDFTGGSLLEVEYTGDRPSVTEIQNVLNNSDLGSLIVQPIGEKGYILRFQDITEEKHQEAITKLKELIKEEDLKSDNDEEIIINASSTDIEIELENETAVGLIELKYDSVGPTIGRELKSKAFNAIAVVLIAIVIYIAWAFRRVSKPVESWKYGITAIIALFHDILITTGVFAFIGHFYGVEVNSAFVAAILTVLGYSVNDTIVVFDRIRENLPQSDEDFESTINTSVNQTIRRSINTSITTLLVLVSILLFGGASIKSFILALAIGVLVGTYSSIFLASPVLVVWEKFKKD